MRIAVVGGGFGGTYALLELQRVLGKGHELLLFEPRARFIFTPLLHEVASGVLDKDTVTINYSDLFSRVQHIRETVQRIDLDKKVIVGKNEYVFDYIIIAVGASTNFFGKRYDALELKSLEDAVTIRSTIEQNVRKAAAMLEDDPDADVEQLLSVIIVGAGPTGVEVAGECIDFLKFRAKREDIRNRTPHVILINAKKAVLPSLDEHFQTTAERVLKKKGITIITDAKVTDIKGCGVSIARAGKNSTLGASCIIWTAGITPNEVEPLGHPVTVTQTLQIPGYEYAFAIGDASRINPSPLPALAQVASKEGEAAADNIARIIAGRRPVAFRFKERGLLVSLGQKNGVGRILGVPVRGFLAWFLMRTIYLFKFRNVRQELRTAYIYTIRLFYRTRSYVGQRVRRKPRSA
jgi:NADH dehydrogenase